MKREHDTSGAPCWCNPTVEPGLVIHNDVEPPDDRPQKPNANGEKPPE